MAESFMDQMDLILLEAIEQYVRACSQSSDIDKQANFCKTCSSPENIRSWFEAGYLSHSRIVEFNIL